MDIVTFCAAALALLATPGPTNTLLATSGAGAGLRASAPLLVAELLGYLLAILLLRLAFGPLIATAPVFGDLLRAVVAIYLLYLAAVLWRHGGHSVTGGAPVSFGRVFVTTVLNPKAIIFAFTLLPSQLGLAALLPWLAALGGLIVCIGGGWILLGAALAHGLKGVMHPRIGYRSSAAALVLLAAVIGSRSLGLL
jgi:threonine/homoserine/homoserine lactone efflux protein